jgi:hypothetical protein
MGSRYRWVCPKLHRRNPVVPIRRARLDTSLGGDLKQPDAAQTSQPPERLFAAGGWAAAILRTESVPWSGDCYWRQALRRLIVNNPKIANECPRGTRLMSTAGHSDYRLFVHDRGERRKPRADLSRRRKGLPQILAINQLPYGSPISLCWRRSTPAPAAPRVTFPVRRSALRPRARRCSEATA